MQTDSANNVRHLNSSFCLEKFTTPLLFGAQLHRVLVEITKHYQKGKPKSAGLVIFMPPPHIDQVTSKGQCISNAAWPAF